MDYFSPVAPIKDENNLAYGYLNNLSDFGPYQDWSGLSTISITSIPDPNDPSTWTWMASYSACGENLEAPEPNTMSFAAVATILGILRMFCKSQKPCTAGLSQESRPTLGSSCLRVAEKRAIPAKCRP